MIRGTACNHGGQAGGLTVPNPEKQAQLLREAWTQAEITPETIDFIEAHGTGTSLGDPIEITGLVKAFQQFTSDKQYCSIGSVKSMVRIFVSWNH